MSVQTGGLESSMEESLERLGLLNGTPPVAIREHEAKGTSWFAASLIIVNAALGAGLLEFPFAYDKAGGVLVAVIVQAVLMIFVIGALLLLAYCSDVKQSATYQDVVYHMCGKYAQTACSITVIVYCYGACITYFIIIGDQWDAFLYHVYGETFCHSWYMNRAFTISSTSTLLIFPFCFPKRIDFLKIPSMLGVIGVVYVVILIIVKYIVGPLDPGPIKTSPTSWMDVFIVVPTICFGYQCHVSVIPIYSCLENRSIKNFGKSVGVAIGICVGSYTIAAVFGYWSFGSKVKADILESYIATPDVIVAIIMVAFKIYTTYPILHFCGRAALESVWIDIRKLPPEEIARNERMRRIIQTIVWYSSTLFLSVIIPNIADVISVLGGLAAIFIFVFPGMCLMQVVLSEITTESNKHRQQILMVLGIAYIVIGAFIFGVTVVQAVMQDVNGKAMESKPLCV